MFPNIKVKTIKLLNRSICKTRIYVITISSLGKFSVLYIKLWPGLLCVVLFFSLGVYILVTDVLFYWAIFICSKISVILSSMIPGRRISINN